jgi:hypothetical protein
MKDTPSTVDPPSTSTENNKKAAINKAKMPDPRGQRLLSSFFTPIAPGDKFKHFNTLFEKFEWERKERQRKEEEQYVLIL